MALYPKAKLRLIPENETQGKIKPRAVILHSAGGEAELYGYWVSKGINVESHFWVSRKGEVYQYIDTDVRADANLNANGYAVSIETQSTVHAAEPWDPAQLQAIIELCDWLCKVHNVPREGMKTPTGSGIAWHIQFGAPGPWTTAKGKVCPGPKRIEQTKNKVIPALAKGPSSTPASDGIIRPGERGEHVKFLQALLNILLANGIKLGNRKPIAVDGVYGNGTTARVREFEQFANGMTRFAAKQAGKKPTGLLLSDGIATRATQAALGFWVKASEKK